MRLPNELDLLNQIATDIHAIKVKLVDEPDQLAKAEADVLRKVRDAIVKNIGEMPEGRQVPR